MHWSLQPLQRARAGRGPGQPTGDTATELHWRDAISVWLFGFQVQELWDVMEICKSDNQTENFKAGKEGLACGD